MKISKKPRYIVGIDLGTTNSALSYVDLESSSTQIHQLAILQWETEGAVSESPLLPSFYYLPTKPEWRRGQLRLPWTEGEEGPDFAVGRLARFKATLVPGRVAHSAKSWLCHAGVIREDRILPWHSDDVIGDERRSPVEVSAAFLAHLRCAWDAKFAVGREDYRLREQDVTITIPASYDEVAQRLTLQAAVLAGFDLERIRLLEEPQAAFYYWLAEHPEGLGLGNQSCTVLVCDVGGGTSDFSLFSIDQVPGGRPVIERIAVSDHVLLGGDNIDLAIAHVLEQKIKDSGGHLSSRQWAQLVFEARKLKEQALAGMADGAAGTHSDELFVAIAGEGSSLFQSAYSVGIEVSQIEQLIIEGFLPYSNDSLAAVRQRTGIVQLGLPYAQDTAITRHLLRFLGGINVDAVMYTGGTLKPRFVRERLTEVITAVQSRTPKILENDEMDLAVARGAAHYGCVLQKAEGRIKSGYARTLYIEVEQIAGVRTGVCVVPRGFDSIEPLRIGGLKLKAWIDRPVRFQLFSSNRRSEDVPGTIVNLDADEFHSLPALHSKLDFKTTKKQGRLVDIELEAVLQETGILQLYCVPKDESLSNWRWQLNFNVRSTASGDIRSDATHTEKSSASPATPKALQDAMCERVDQVFGKKYRADLAGHSPKNLVRELEALSGKTRDLWDLELLRSFWPALEPGLTRRSRSVAHETTWLYLAGYSLRPGYGHELDEWRVMELWRTFSLGIAYSDERQVEEQWWIMWRRVAGGLNREQQEALYDRIFPQIRKGDLRSPELYLLAGSLERIEMGKKLRLGNILVQHIASGKRTHIDQCAWALARIASRVPLYAGSEAIVRPKFVAEWFAALSRIDFSQNPYQRLVQFLVQAARIVEDREFDLAEPLRGEILSKLERSGASEEQLAVVKSYVPIDGSARVQLFGESLPAGLVLQH